MAATTASPVAESLINLSHDKGSPVTNLKLQKLLYYAQAWHLVFYNAALFDEQIEAWVHGPVVPSVFRTYRYHRWNILARSQTSKSVERTATHLEEIWRVYGKFEAWQLERLTHDEKPWQQARAGLPSDVASHNVITAGSMKDYYSSLLNG